MAAYVHVQRTRERDLERAVLTARRRLANGDAANKIHPTVRLRQPRIRADRQGPALRDGVLHGDLSTGCSVSIHENDFVLEAPWLIGSIAAGAGRCPDDGAGVLAPHAEGTPISDPSRPADQAGRPGSTPNSG